MLVRMNGVFDSYYEFFVEKHSIRFEDFYDADSANRYIKEGIKFDFQNNFDAIDSDYELIDVEKDDEPLKHKEQLEFINDWINKL